MRASAIKGAIDMNKDLFTNALGVNDEMQQVYKESLHEQTTKFLNDYKLPNEVAGFLISFSFNTINSFIKLFLAINISF